MEHNRKSNVTDVQIIHLICLLLLINPWSPKKERAPNIPCWLRRLKRRRAIWEERGTVVVMKLSLCPLCWPTDVWTLFLIRYSHNNNGTHMLQKHKHAEPSGHCLHMLIGRWACSLLLCINVIRVNKKSMNQIPAWKKTCKPSFCTCHFTSRTLLFFLYHNW